MGSNPVGLPPGFEVQGPPEGFEIEGQLPAPPKAGAKGRKFLDTPVGAGLQSLNKDFQTTQKRFGQRGLDALKGLYQGSKIFNPLHVARDIYSRASGEGPGEVGQMLEGAGRDYVKGVQNRSQAASDAYRRSSGSFDDRRDVAGRFGQAGLSLIPGMEQTMQTGERAVGTGPGQDDAIQGDPAAGADLGFDLGTIAAGLPPEASPAIAAAREGAMQVGRQGMQSLQRGAQTAGRYAGGFASKAPGAQKLIGMHKAGVNAMNAGKPPVAAPAPPPPTQMMPPGPRIVAPSPNMPPMDVSLPPPPQAPAARPPMAAQPPQPPIDVPLPAQPKPRQFPQAAAPEVGPLDVQVPQPQQPPAQLQPPPQAQAAPGASSVQPGPQALESIAVGPKSQQAIAQAQASQFGASDVKKAFGQPQPLPHTTVDYNPAEFGHQPPMQLPPMRQAQPTASGGYGLGVEPVPGKVVEGGPFAHTVVDQHANASRIAFENRMMAEAEAAAKAKARTPPGEKAPIDPLDARMEERRAVPRPKAHQAGKGRKPRKTE